MDLIKALLKLTLAGAVSLSALLVLSHYWSDIESYLDSNTYVHLSCIETKIDSTAPSFRPSQTILKIAKNKKSGESDIDDSELIQWPRSLLEGSVEDVLKSYPAPKSLWAASRGSLQWLLGDTSSGSDTVYRFNVVSGYRDNMDIVIDRTNRSFTILEQYLYDSCDQFGAKQGQVLRETRLCSSKEVKKVHASGTCEIIAAEEYTSQKEAVVDRYEDMEKLQSQMSNERKARELESLEKKKQDAKDAQVI